MLAETRFVTTAFAAALLLLGCGGAQDTPANVPGRDWSGQVQPPQPMG